MSVPGKGTELTNAMRAGVAWFGELLELVEGSLGSRARLAAMAGVDGATIQRWQRAEDFPTRGQRERLAERVPEFASLFDEYADEWEALDAELGRDEDIVVTTAARIREARETLGYTPQQLAKLLGVTPQRVRGWEQGILAFETWELEAVASLLDLPSEDLSAMNEVVAGEIKAKKGIDTSAFAAQLF